MRPSNSYSRHLPLTGFLAFLLFHQLPAASATAMPVEREMVSQKADTVRGLVFDSLTNEPLADAFLSSDAGGSATSDSLGRFVLVSEGQTNRITAFHSSLDETGFGALEAQRPEGVTRWDNAELVTPSLNAVWSSLCGRVAPEGIERGVLLGSARMADDRTRISGARIHAQYESILPTSGLSQLENLDVITDSVGTYVICGVPIAGDVALVGLSNEVQSGVILTELAGRPLLRMDLVLGPSDGPVSRWPTLTGRVNNARGEPLAGADVEVDGREGSVKTDSDGRFSLPEAPLGTRMLTVQGEGHVPAAIRVDVVYDKVPEIQIQLSEPLELFSALQGVTITERTRIRRTRQEFEDRKLAGIASFVDSTYVRSAGSLSEALSNVSGLEVRRVPGSEDPADWELLGQGTGLSVDQCRANLLVDGLPAMVSDLSDLRLEEVAYLEIYRSSRYAPPLFIGEETRDCALIVIWTQYGLRP